MSTHDQYERMARFTVSQIEKQWANHPALYVCGLTNPASQTDLLLKRDTADWIGILLDAVNSLLAKRLTFTYLILDDHPPLGCCRADIQNEVLPAIMNMLGSANISLFGSGQGRELSGKPMFAEGIRLEQLSESELWRYSLHPGLWSLEQLKNLLQSLDERLPSLESRTAWAFERISGAPRSSCSDSVMTSSYRITSPAMVASQSEQVITEIIRTIGHISRSFAGAIGGKRAWHRASQSFDRVNHYYGGPYPMFWRGMFTKGLPNNELMTFLTLMGKRKEFDFLFAQERDS